MIRSVESSTNSRTTITTITERRRWPREHYAALIGQLQTNDACWTDSIPRAIGVTSCTEGQGVSTVAANLAISAAKLSTGPVVLVDANVRDPSVGKTFGVESSEGLTDVLRGERQAYQCVVKSRIEGLSLLLPGMTGQFRQPAYEAASIDEMVVGLKHVFQLIVIDLPIANEITTCMSMAGRLDGIVMVVEAERDTRYVARRTQQQLEQYKAKLLGVVYNKSRAHVPDWLNRML